MVVVQARGWLCAGAGADYTHSLWVELAWVQSKEWSLDHTWQNCWSQSHEHCGASYVANRGCRQARAHVQYPWQMCRVERASVP